MCEIKPTSRLSRYDQIFYLGLALYCLVFWGFRLFLSPTLLMDEAEQYWDAQRLAWGYSFQAPLYTWITWSVSQVTGLNLPTLATLKYLFIFWFYAGYYRLTRFWWEGEDRIIITTSLLLMPLFIFNFTWDLTHTILLGALTVTALNFYFSLLKTGSIKDYSGLGIILALGILTKYNYLFFGMSLMMAAFTDATGRKRLFSSKIVWTLAPLILIPLPHLYWLILNDFPPFRSALEIAKVTPESKLALEEIVEMFFKYIGPILLYIFFYFVLFRGCIQKKLISADKELHPPLERYVFWILTIPLVMFYLMQADNFSSRWVIPTYLSVPLLLFTRVDFQKFYQTRRKYYLYGILLLVMVGILYYRMSQVYQPEGWVSWRPGKKKRGEVTRLNTPYPALVKRLQDEKLINDPSGAARIVTDRHQMASNLLLHIKTIPIYPESEYIQSHGTDTVLLLWTTRAEVVDIPLSTLDYSTVFRSGWIDLPYRHTHNSKPIRFGYRLVQTR